MNDRIIDLILGMKSKCLEKEESIRQEFGLSPAEYRGITAMDFDQPCNCNKLSQKMGLSVSRGSRVIEKLVKNKYIISETAQTDKRNIILHLAPRGIRIKKKIDSMLNECEQVIESKLTNTEIKNTLKIFQKLGNCL
ncbi:MAG: MarR family winged helix-turn-helix transcriptional regulator [Bacteroidetes bacterium]|nr:MarR family winged helix-turn-helix transcriptional regulator [Bacteroidota bacterium]